MANKIWVEVVYALPLQQWTHRLQVNAGARVEQVIRSSGILLACPELKLQELQVGIWGKLVHLDHQIAAEDRIEIYRPLTADPKIARQRKVLLERRAARLNKSC